MSELETAMMDTAPQDPAPQAEEAAAPELESTTSPAEGTAAEAAPQDNGTDPGSSAETDAEGGIPSFLTVDYEHEIKELSEEEARNYAQRGMYLEKVTPYLDKIRYLAAAEGKPMKDYIDSLVSARKEAVRNRYAGSIDDEQMIDSLMELEDGKIQKAMETAKQEEESNINSGRKEINDRLAGEFVELREEFPELTEFGKVPKTVIQTAISKKMPLMAAYLLHQRAEEKKITAQKAAQDAAKSATAGDITSGTHNEESPELSALMRGIWG